MQYKKKIKERKKEIKQTNKIYIGKKSRMNASCGSLTCRTSLKKQVTLIASVKVPI